jgi:hypothetical protein
VKDVVVIPVYHRTNYLLQTLNALLNARGIEDKKVWFYQDNHIGCPDLKPVQDTVLEIIHRFKDPEFWIQEPHDGVGYLYNTHMALKRAYESGAEKIYYLEDDVVVTPDFFEWHDAVQADGDWMCSSAWRPPSGTNEVQDIEWYYRVSFPTTISIGTCFKRDKLGLALKTLDWNPQDRMLNENWKCVMPWIQRCYHIGAKSCHPGPNDCPPEAVDVVPDPIPDYTIRGIVLSC